MAGREGRETIRFEVNDVIPPLSLEGRRLASEQAAAFNTLNIKPWLPRLRRQMERGMAKDVDLEKIMRQEEDLSLAAFKSAQHAAAEGIPTLHLGASTLYVVHGERFRLRPSAPALLAALHRDHPDLKIQLLPDKRMTVDELPEIAMDMNVVLKDDVVASVDPVEFEEQKELTRRAIAEGFYASGTYSTDSGHAYGSINTRKKADYDFGTAVLLERLTGGRSIYLGDVQASGVFRFGGQTGQIKRWQRLNNGIHSFIYNEVDGRFAAQWVNQPQGITRADLARSLIEDTFGVGRTIYYKSKRKN